MGSGKKKKYNQLDMLNWEDEQIADANPNNWYAFDDWVSEAEDDLEDGQDDHIE